MIDNNYLDNICQTFQVDYVAITLLSQHKSKHYWNYPKDWQEHYVKQNYGLIDYAHSQLNFKPCIWDDATNGYSNPKQKKIIFEAQQASINSGVSFYIGNKNDQRLFITYASRKCSEVFSRDIDCISIEMQLFAQILGNIISSDASSDILHSTLEMMHDQLKNKFKKISLQQEMQLLLNIIKSNSETYVTWKFLPEFEPYINRANDLARSLFFKEAPFDEVSIRQAYEY